MRVQLDEVIAAVEKFAEEVKQQGSAVNIEGFKLQQLRKDIQAEYRSGQQGTVYEVMVGLFDSVGYSEYDIKV